MDTLPDFRGYVKEIARWNGIDIVVCRPKNDCGVILYSSHITALDKIVTKQWLRCIANRHRVYIGYCTEHSCSQYCVTNQYSAPHLQAFWPKLSSCRQTSSELRNSIKQTSTLQSEPSGESVYSPFFLLTASYPCQQHALVRFGLNRIVYIHSVCIHFIRSFRLSLQILYKVCVCVVLRLSLNHQGDH